MVALIIITTVVVVVSIPIASAWVYCVFYRGAIPNASILRVVFVAAIAVNASSWPSTSSSPPLPTP
eukprot:9877820-Lingulodinium_polyedra.AAC.1